MKRNPLGFLMWGQNDSKESNIAINVFYITLATNANSHSLEAKIENRECCVSLTLLAINLDFSQVSFLKENFASAL